MHVGPRWRGMSPVGESIQKIPRERDPTSFDSL